MIFLNNFFFYISQHRNSCSDVMLLFRIVFKVCFEFGVCSIENFALEMSAAKVKAMCMHCQALSL